MTFWSWPAGETKLAGSDGWVAALYGSAPGGALGAVGAPIKFRDGDGIGYWPGETRTIPGVPENGTAQLQVKVFNTALGTSFEEVQSKGLGYWGQSEVLPAVATGGGQNPPAPMLGLASFHFVMPVPEPSITSLLLLGLGASSFRRRESHGSAAARPAVRDSIPNIAVRGVGLGR